MATPTANTLAYAQIFQDALDDQMIQEATTAWMEPNSSMVRYNGGNTIRIPKIVTEGLGDYNRTTGYPSGAATLSFESHTFDKDRGKQFDVDSQDVDETNFAATVGNILSTFQRTQVIPEVDAYRYSKVFDYANLGGQLRSYTPDSSTIFSQLKADISTVRDIVGEQEGLVIAMPFSVADTLENSTQLTKQLRVDDMTMGINSMGKPVESRVTFLDQIPIMKVSSARLKSLYTFSATNGFSADANALDINWLIMSRRSIIAVTKTDKVRIFDPEVNQYADAYRIQARKYHTLWIPDNKVVGVYASYTAATAPVLTATVAAGTGTGNTKFTATAGAGNTLAYKLGAAAGTYTDSSYGIVVAGTTGPYTSGADIAATAGQFLNMYELDSEGKVVKFAQFELTATEIS